MAGLNTATPYGLTLQQTITSGTSVTIPAGINWAYAILVGGGGSAGGGAGGVTFGWALVKASMTCVIGAGGTAGGVGSYTLFSNLIAGGGGGGNAVAGTIGGAPLRL